MNSRRALGGTIVVAGGYGDVGRLVSLRLAQLYPGRVLVAGRDLGQAAAVAALAGHGTRAGSLDVTAPSTFTVQLESAAAVISCVAHSEESFARACLGAGVHYVDITADAEAIAAVERLDTLARDAGSVGVLSVGLAPGLTNLLARSVCPLLGSVHRLDLGVQLGVTDDHGPGALAWTLENLAAPYMVICNGVPAPATPFGRHCTLHFGEARSTWVSSFNFPEQRTLARTLNIPSVSSWLALQPQAVHAVAAASARIGLLGLARVAARPSRGPGRARPVPDTPSGLRGHRPGERDLRWASGPRRQLGRRAWRGRRDRTGRRSRRRTVAYRVRTARSPAHRTAHTS